MSSMTCIISIGRNQRGIPMNTDVWSEFKSKVMLAAAGWGNVVMRPTVAYAFPSSQLGIWGKEMEECAVWMVQVGKVDSETVESGLGIELAQLAKAYGQEAIGFICHRGTTLVPRL